jgi:transcriptional regulator
MYHLPYFKEEDPQKIIAFMKANPFAMLIGSLNDHPVATQVPFLVEQKEDGLFLYAHMMRGTDHFKAISTNKNVLAVFTGVHSYVSARWYDNPQTGSTWNYSSVHIRGDVSLIDGEGLRSILQKLTTHFEADASSPANYEHLPEAYIAKLEKAIVGIEMKVTSIENVFKLSQNRNEAERVRIIEGLQKGSDEQKAMAAEMGAKYSRPPE